MGTKSSSDMLRAAPTCLHAEDGLCVPPHGPFLCWGHSGMWQLLAERTEIFSCVCVSEGDDL